MTVDTEPKPPPLDRTGQQIIFGDTVAYASHWGGRAHLRLGRIEDFHHRQLKGWLVKIRGTTNMPIWKASEDVVLLRDVLGGQRALPAPPPRKPWGSNRKQLTA